MRLHGGQDGGDGAGLGGQGLGRLGGDELLGEDGRRAGLLNDLLDGGELGRAGLGVGVDAGDGDWVRW